MAKIVAILIAAFFAVTAVAADNAPIAKTNPAAHVRTAQVTHKTEVQKSKKKKKKKTSKHSKKSSKKAAATPAAGQ